MPHRTSWSADVQLSILFANWSELMISFCGTVTALDWPVAHRLDFPSPVWIFLISLRFIVKKLTKQPGPMEPSTKFLRTFLAALSCTRPVAWIRLLMEDGQVSWIILCHGLKRVMKAFVSRWPSPPWDASQKETKWRSSCLKELCAKSWCGWSRPAEMVWVFCWTFGLHSRALP